MLNNISYKSLMKYLLIFALLALSLAAPADDEVRLPIKGYTDHRWYSGTDVFIQVCLISILLHSTMSSSTHKGILIMTLSFFGSMEGLAAPASSA